MLRRFHRGGRGPVVRTGWLLPSLAIVLFAATLLAPGCARNPVTGKSEFSLVSESQEIEMGREGDKAIVAEFGLYDDPELAATVDRIGQKLAATSERPNLEWHFRVLDSPVVNAFALPGGYIYVTRGIMAVLNSEAQLAGVLGHEIGHVTARHSAKQMTQQTLASLGLGVTAIFVEDFRPYSDVAAQGLGLLFLKFGRDHERQADELGVRYATQAAFDPREIPPTYKALKQLATQSGQSLPNFLSTHPDPGQREVTTTELAQAAIAGKDPATLRVGTNDFKRELDGVVYGDDPRQGYVESGVFYHPGLRFQVRFPAGWSVQNTPQAVTGVNSGKTAGVQLSLVSPAGAASPSDYVRALRDKQQISAYEGTSNRVRSWNAWVGRIAVASQQGGTSTLHAAWVARESERYYQFIGVPGDEAGRGGFQAVLTSFDDLTDAAKLGRQPNRVDVVEVTQPSATVATVARSVPLAVPVEEVAFLNNTTPDAILRQGYVLKVVRKP